MIKQLSLFDQPSEENPEIFEIADFGRLSSHYECKAERDGVDVHIGLCRYVYPLLEPQNNLYCLGSWICRGSNGQWTPQERKIADYLEKQLEIMTLEAMTKAGWQKVEHLHTIEGFDVSLPTYQTARKTPVLQTWVLRAV